METRKSQEPVTELLGEGAVIAEMRCEHDPAGRCRCRVVLYDLAGRAYVVVIGEEEAAALGGCVTAEHR